MTDKLTHTHTPQNGFFEVKSVKADQQKTALFENEVTFSAFKLSQSACYFSQTSSLTSLILRSVSFY